MFYLYLGTPLSKLKTLSLRVPEVPHTPGQQSQSDYSRPEETSRIFRSSTNESAARSVTAERRLTVSHHRSSPSNFESEEESKQDGQDEDDETKKLLGSDTKYAKYS